MAVEISNGICPNCGRGVKIEKKGASHIIHFILTILTSGIWLIVWVICGIMGTKWRCLSCGSIATKDTSSSSTRMEFKTNQTNAGQGYDLSEQRKCTFCAEYIKIEAIKCRFCHSEVSPIETEFNDKEKTGFGKELDLESVDTDKIKLPPLIK
jgi:hypothetical protein